MRDYLPKFLEKLRTTISLFNEMKRSFANFVKSIIKSHFSRFFVLLYHLTIIFQSFWVR